MNKMTRDPPKKPKTIRQYFKATSFGTVRFFQSPALAEATSNQQQKRKPHIVDHSLAWKTYYVKLLVLAQARQWLSATEQLDPIADAPSTPKTNFQLADAIKQPKNAEYAPFGGDFEDTTALLSADCSSMQRSTIAATTAMAHSALQNKCRLTHTGSYRN